MKRIVWLSDIHLNFVYYYQIQSLCNNIVEMNPDAVVISGDIAEGDSVCDYLTILQSILSCPIYFVLGNHDYYNSSISIVRDKIEELTACNSLLKWLPKIGIVKLTDKACLIGHGAWGDGRFGKYATSNFDIADNHLIYDFVELDKESRLKKLNLLGTEAAAYFEKQLNQALKSYEHIIILTHVPPFWEASFYRKGLSLASSVPYFACKSVGEVLKGKMNSEPERNMTVLCGHTHAGGTCQIAPNLFVKTAGARYKHPRVEEVLEID